MSDNLTMEQPISVEGRPSNEIVEQHYEEALKMYLQGVTNASHIARKLNVSPQTGANLLNRIRNDIQRQTTTFHSPMYFEVERQNAVERAEQLLYEAWLSYQNTAPDSSKKSQALSVILAIQKYIAELSGVATGVNMVTRSAVTQFTGALEDMSKIMKDLKLTHDDFKEDKYPETMKMILEYYRNECGNGQSPSHKVNHKGN